MWLILNIVDSCLVAHKGESFTKHSCHFCTPSYLDRISLPRDDPFRRPAAVCPFCCHLLPLRRSLPHSAIKAKGQRPARKIGRTETDCALVSFKIQSGIVVVWSGLGVLVIERKPNYSEELRDEKSYPDFIQISETANSAATGSV